jgi:hypothetical protein
MVMSGLTLDLLQEMVAITHEPTIVGVQRLIALQGSENNRVSLVAISAGRAISEGRELNIDDFTLLLDLTDLN